MHQLLPSFVPCLHLRLVSLYEMEDEEVRPYPYGGLLMLCGHQGPAKGHLMLEASTRSFLEMILRC